jgi:hypothetical protein
MNIEKYIKELEELSFIIPDGFYKNCKVYHTATESFLRQALTQIVAERDEEWEKCIPNEVNDITNDYYNECVFFGYNRCIEDFKQNIKDKIGKNL